MDDPKNVAERYDCKHILIIAKLKVVLDYIFYILYLHITTETQGDVSLKNSHL
jgi:hypothetical protein